MEKSPSKSIEIFSPQTQINSKITHCNSSSSNRNIIKANKQSKFRMLRFGKSKKTTSGCRKF